MARTAALPALKAESGLSHYLDEIRRFPMLEPQEEYMLARSWREHGDREAVHKLVTSHLRLVAKIAMGYRGYGLPISEVVSEGNVGLMQAVKRFEPEKGFRLATYAMWWIKAAIQEYILRSWSLVKMGTTANQKKLFFNLRKAKSKISALDEGDLRPDQVQVIAKRLGVTEQDVVDMNRRLGGDASLNAPIRDDGESGEWQDWLVDDAPSQERILAESEESDNQLFIIASGAPADVEICRPLFAEIGQQTFVIGTSPADANLFKLLGNMMTATALETLGEVVAVIRKRGLDPKSFMDLMTSTFYGGRVHRIYGDKIAGQNYEPGFILPLALKDVRLALTEAESAGVPLPSLGVVRDRMITGIARGYAELDWTALGLVAAEEAGIHATPAVATNFAGSQPAMLTQGMKS
jgi:RNA polymerase sigma-32 factor